VLSIIAAAMAAMLGIVIDGIIVGRFMGPDSMAAYGLVTPIVNLTTAFAGILATGTQVICAQRLGAGDAKSAKSAFSMCMTITMVISAILMTLLLVFRNNVAFMLGAQGNSAKLLPLASDYILGLVPSIPSVLLLLEFNSLMRLDGDANRVVVAVSVMTVLDAAGDLLVVFVFKAGMLGMGLATSISYSIGLIIMLLHFTKKDIIFKPSLKGLKLKDLGEILGTGSSSAMGSTSAMVRNMVLNRIMVATVLSSTAVAALGVLNTVVNFTSSSMLGVGMTAAMIAGMILGEQDRSAAEELVKVTSKTALIFGVGLGVVVFAAADLIAGIFGGEKGAEMVSLASRGLRFYSVSLILYGLNAAFINYTQGMRRMAISNIYCLLQNLVFIALPALALAGVLDTDAVWVSFIIGESLTFICIIILAAIRKKGFPYRAKDFLFVKEPFGAAEGEFYEVTIGDEKDIIPASEKVGEFCESKGADQKQVYLMALFVEELGNNTVKFGFKGKKNTIDIRVINMDGDWIIRFRDNAKAFDPTEWIKLHESDDPTANLGIRMVCRMAKDVKYLSTMDLNILTIRI